MKLQFTCMLMTPSWCARPIDDINMVTEKAQNVFKKMTTWCDANKLTINVEKTKYMVIRHTKPPKNLISEQMFPN